MAGYNKIMHADDFVLISETMAEQPKNTIL